LDLPVDDPVLYWRGGDERRCVIGLPLEVTKIVLTRLLKSYRQPYVVQSLLTGALADPGGCRYTHTRAGHIVGLVRPYVLSEPTPESPGVLVAIERNGRLFAPLLARSDDGHAYLASRFDGWTAASYAGEWGESRSHLFWSEGLERPDRSNPKTELELAAWIAISRTRDRRTYAA
jgi:hypothetical protein